MKYVVSLSGGLDSSTALAFIRDMDPDAVIQPVFFRYGSKHGPHEERAAQSIAKHYGLEIIYFDCTAFFAGVGSALLAHDQRKIPTAEYNQDNMAQTVVPGRNLIFASLMASWAESNGFDHLVMGMHGGDHHLYPDCRPAFVAALNQTLAEGTDGALKLLTPFLHYSKTRIVQTGLALRVPYEKTRSCYMSDYLACGLCGTCQERLQAFADNGVVDPAEYQSLIGISQL